MSNGTNRATLFSEDLARKLCELSKDGRLEGYCWNKNGHPEGSPRECVDVVGTPKNSRCPLIFVEAELRRGNPESNVAKIWKWLQGQRSGQPILLIQAFSKYYNSSSPQVHKETSIFFGKQMCKAHARIRYIPLDLNYAPGPGNHVKGAGRRTQHAQELAEFVARRTGREVAKLKLRDAQRGDD